MPLLTKEIKDRIISRQTRQAEILRAQKIIQASETLQNRQLIEAWAIIGKANMWEKEAEKCEQAYLHCLDIIIVLQDNILLSECYEDLGFALYFCRQYNKALAYYERAADIAQQFRDPQQLCIIYSQMAKCCADLGLMEQERTYLSQGIDLPIDPLIKATMLERVSISYANSSQYREAAKHYEEALSIFEHNNFKRFWEDRVKSLIEIYRALGDEDAVQRTIKRK